MKTVARALLIFTIFLFSIYFFAPDEKIERLIWKYKILTKDPVALCIEHYRNEFTDPTSVKPIKNTIENGYQHFSIYVSAKNKMGGTGKEKLYCLPKNYSYDDDSNLDELEKNSALSRATDAIRQETQRLKQEIEERKARSGKF